MLALLNNPTFNCGLILVILLGSFLFARGRSSSKNRVKYEVLNVYQDEKCRPVIKVRSPNARDADQAIRGTTYPGNVSWTQRKQYPGGNEYLLSVEDWKTEFKKKGKRR